MPSDTRPRSQDDTNIPTPEAKSKPGDFGTKAFAPEPGFRQSPANPSQQPEPIGLKEMADFLREKLDVPIRTGRFFKGGRRKGVSQSLRNQVNEAENGRSP